jgi:hypothetical protein
LVVLSVGQAIAGCDDSDDGEGSNTTGGSAGAASGGTAGSGMGGTGMAGGGTAGGGRGGSGGGGSGGANAACSAAPYEHTFGFGALFEGWAISSFSTPSLVPVPGTGGMGGSSGSGMVAGGEGGDAPGGAGGTSPMGTIMELDTSDGAPDSPDGSLKLTIPFDAPAQLLLLGTVFNTGLNFTGTSVTAQIKLDSGLITGPSDTATANLVLKSGEGFIYYAGPATVLDPTAGWVTLRLDPETPSAEALAAGYSPCAIREIDIEIRTGNTGSYQQAVVHVDAVSVAPKQ